MAFKLNITLNCPIPTFDSQQDSPEVFLLDTDLEVPPKEVSFELVQYLRHVMKFDTSEALVKQIDQDVKNCREILSTQ